MIKQGIGQHFNTTHREIPLIEDIQIFYQILYIVGLWQLIYKQALTFKYFNRARVYGRPNTYVFTKAMVGMLLGYF